MYSSYMKRAAGFFGLLSGLNKTYLDVCCKALGDPRLSRAEVAILLSLQGEPLCNTANGLCARLGFSKGRISQALVSLEEKGFLQAGVSSRTAGFIPSACCRPPSRPWPGWSKPPVFLWSRSWATSPKGIWIPPAGSSRTSTGISISCGKHWIFHPPIFER